MSLGASQWFWGLLAIPFVVALFLTAEKRGEKRLREFVSARLLPQLAGTVNRFRRALRFALQLLGLAFAIVSLAQPRLGYTFEDVKRKGLDLLIAVDTSRSMLSNDIQPDRLERVKLAAQDLINELQGDRVGLIAFAGRAFLQAPLTIDYEAVMESINNLDAKTIPEGGTNISSAITLATQSFGKSATGNRALIIFTDGEELSGDAVKTAKTAADAGVRIFTIGVGTPQGSLIPITGENGEKAFGKDSAGQLLRSKLDDAYSQFQETLKSHPQSGAEAKLQFDSGAAAYKLKDYSKALESFSQALLSLETRLQSKSHYNLGNTLYQRGETQKSDDKKLSDWTNALDHYVQTLKLEPQDKEAKENYDYVKKKIEELKNKKNPEQQPSPSPSPSPPPKNKQDKQNRQQQKQQQQNQQQDQGQQQQKDQQQSQARQSQGQSG